MSDEIKDETPKAEAAPDSTQLRAEIEETRAEMTQTIDALQEKLDPQHLKEQILDKVHDATIGQVEHLAQVAHEKLGPAIDQVEHFVHEASEKFGDTFDIVEDKYEEAVKKLGHMAGPPAALIRHKGEDLVATAKRKPAIAAAAGVAVAGLALGWRLYSNRQRNRI